MKENINGEKIILFIISIIIIIVIGYVVYTIFSSNKNFYTNENNNKNNKVDFVDQTEKQPNQQNIDKNTNTNPSNIENTKKTIETEIASFTSTLYDKDENRVYNIGLAIEKLNGIIVKKDSEFSFNNTIGPMDESHGYKEAVRF